MKGKIACWKLVIGSETWGHNIFWTYHCVVDVPLPLSLIVSREMGRRIIIAVVIVYSSIMKMELLSSSMAFYTLSVPKHNSFLHAIRCQYIAIYVPLSRYRYKQNRQYQGINSRTYKRCNCKFVSINLLAMVQKETVPPEKLPHIFVDDGSVHACLMTTWLFLLHRKHSDLIYLMFRSLSQHILTIKSERLRERERERDGWMVIR